jgi:uncharacterized surface anchored protein
LTAIITIKKLSGATFELYQITTDANGQQTSTLINSGITDAEGQLVFDKSSNGNPLSFNTVYYVKETKAPNGYTIDEQ